MGRGPALLLALLPAVAAPLLLRLTGGGVWPVLGAYHALCYLAFLLLPPVARREGLRPGNPRRWIGPALALSAGLLAAAAVLPEAAVPALPGLDAIYAEMTPFPLFAAYTLLVNPLAEELYWRELLLPATGVAGGGVLFWLMHAAAFGHFLGLAAIPFTLPALFLGIAWGALRRRQASLWPCVLTHLAADAAILLLAARLFRA